MKQLFFIITSIFLLFGCSSEKINGQQENKDSLNINKPQTKIIVNKEYDESGNLIRFDSSYSYFYSNINQDSLLFDSSFSFFQNDFFESFPKVQKPFLNDIFFEDSLLSYDFYKDDFFSQRYRLNRDKFDRLFYNMDSLKNNFFDNFKDDKEGTTKDP